MSIWHAPFDIADMNRLNENTIHTALGIEFIEAGDDYLMGRMPVDSRTQQPYGILHGGASVVLAESLGSSAGALCLDPAKHFVVGVEVNANHIRSVREGYVTGVARPSHLGRSIHVWEIKITDDAGKLSCTSRLTLAVRSHEIAGG